MSNIARKLLASLRVGDVVRLSQPVFHERNKTEELVVKITKVDNVDAYIDNAGRFSLPVIHWEPRPEDFIEMVDGHKDNLAYCNAGHVTEIIERQPYVVSRNQTQNILFNPRVAARTDKIFGTRHGNCIAIDVRSLANIIVRQDPHLVIRYGLSDEKLMSEWKKAGRPGLRGYQTYGAEGVAANKPAGFGSNWMHKPTFKVWLLKRLSYVIRTKKEYRSDLIELLRLEEEDYYSDAA